MQFFGRTLGDDAPGADDGDAAAELLGLFQIMRRQEDRHSVGIEGAKPLPQLEAQLDVDAGGRLVENQQLGLVNQRASQREPAFLTARDFRVLEMRVRGKPEALEQHVGALVDLLAAQTVVAGGVNENVAQREVPVEVELLRREPDQAPRLTPIALVVVAEDADRAGARARQADDRVDRRRLARAVGAEEAEELAGADAQRDAVDGGKAAVPLDEMLDLDGGRRESSGNDAL